MFQGTVGEWHQFSADEVREVIFDRANDPGLDQIVQVSDKARQEFGEQQAEILSMISLALEKHEDAYLQKVQQSVEELSVLTRAQAFSAQVPNRGLHMSRDTEALAQGLKVAPHQVVVATVFALRAPFDASRDLSHLAGRAASHLGRQPVEPDRELNAERADAGARIFIGHGRSRLWMELKDFIQDRLQLPWDEFNRSPVAGIANQERLLTMLDGAGFAFVVVTAEDEQADGTVQARQNVVHEVGLFQGRLGFTRAIVMLEEGCEEFSNIQGTGQIRFPSGNIRASFEEVRRVLEREGFLDAD